MLILRLPEVKRFLGLDVTRFNRHLLRSKLNWSDSHEESEIPSRIQG
jgi:hypothetical protein